MYVCPYTDMSLHAISVFDKVYKWSPENHCTSKVPVSASKMH